ncbi:hypothetical protein [Ruminococcus sp.]|uniref:hypothetical protein n=1 Tax=Ruminococcus sp. TaxID=41978 RepID=UPI0025F0A464|nr:hypothetical protein [Ruminococcus sp.]
MRIRYYYISVVVLMICFFSLTACVPYHPMKITVDELTVDTDIYMLLKPNAEQLKEQSDDEFMKCTEIWNYNKFGWVSASLAVNEVHERRPDIYTSEYILEVGYKKADGADKVRDFCETFKEMRFAIVDKKGNIKNVSKTYSLIPEDKFGYPCEMIYNAKNDT